jgi:hypothetical protein
VPQRLARVAAATGTSQGGTEVDECAGVLELRR